MAAPLIYSGTRYSPDGGVGEVNETAPVHGNDGAGGRAEMGDAGRSSRAEQTSCSRSVFLRVSMIVSSQEHVSFPSVAPTQHLSAIFQMRASESPLEMAAMPLCLTQVGHDETF
ncbi:unnamed protein product [Arctogadus glacialis]